MSLGETQAIFEQLQRINDILTAIETKTQGLERQLPETKEAVMTVQQFTRILYRMNHILAHMGLPENVNGAIRKLQELVFMARMVQMSISLLQLSTPYGWITGTLGLVSVGLSFTDWSEMG